MLKLTRQCTYWKCGANQYDLDRTWSQTSCAETQSPRQNTKGSDSEVSKKAILKKRKRFILLAESLISGHPVSLRVFCEHQHQYGYCFASVHNINTPTPQPGFRIKSMQRLCCEQRSTSPVSGRTSSR